MAQFEYFTVSLSFGRQFFVFFLLSRTVGELHYIVTVKLFPNFESCNYDIEVT